MSFWRVPPGSSENQGRATGSVRALFHGDNAAPGQGKAVPLTNQHSCSGQALPAPMPAAPPTPGKGPGGFPGGRCKARRRPHPVTGSARPRPRSCPLPPGLPLQQLPLLAAAGRLRAVQAPRFLPCSPPDKRSARPRAGGPLRPPPSPWRVRPAPHAPSTARAAPHAPRDPRPLPLPACLGRAEPIFPRRGGRTRHGSNASSSCRGGGAYRVSHRRGAASSVPSADGVSSRRTRRQRGVGQHRPCPPCANAAMAAPRAAPPRLLWRRRMRMRSAFPWACGASEDSSSAH